MSGLSEMSKLGAKLFKNAGLCTQCGYCLPMCPTYRVENNELHAPRGRVSILLALQSGDLTVAEAASALDHCLVCRACHTACPAGVRPAKLALTVRTVMPQRPTFFRALFHHICSHHRLTAGLSALLAFYQRSGLQQRVRRGRGVWFFPRLAALEGLVPRYRPEVCSAPLAARMDGEDTQSLAHARSGAASTEVALTAPVVRVGLLCGCMARLFSPGVAPSVVQLLTAMGIHVVVLEGFGCCGAPYRELGDRVRFLRQARHTLDLYLAAGPLDTVVCDSSVCAITARSYARALAKDAKYAKTAEDFSAKTKTLSQFLVKKWFDKPWQSEGCHDTAWRAACQLHDPGLGVLAYHDHCQARHGLGILSEPRALLRSLPTPCHELSRITDPAHDGCCGTGGDYVLRHPGRSRNILQQTLVAIQESGVDTVVGENPGCLLSVAAGLEQMRSTVQVRHLAEVLWKAHPSNYHHHHHHHHHEEITR